MIKEPKESMTMPHQIKNTNKDKENPNRNPQTEKNKTKQKKTKNSLKGHKSTFKLAGQKGKRNLTSETCGPSLSTQYTVKGVPETRTERSRENNGRNA
jgi:hypothetical protein